jgi:hypothetical protein
MEWINYHVITQTTSSKLSLFSFDDDLYNEGFGLIRRWSYTQIENVHETLETVEGDLCHINLAESRLLYFEKKKRPMPWKATLNIVSKLNIQISAYVYVRDTKFISTDSNIPNTVVSNNVKHWQNNEIIEYPDLENVIKKLINMMKS